MEGRICEREMSWVCNKRVTEWWMVRVVMMNTFMNTFMQTCSQPTNPVCCWEKLSNYNADSVIDIGLQEGPQSAKNDPTLSVATALSCSCLHQEAKMSFLCGIVTETIVVAHKMSYLYGCWAVTLYTCRLPLSSCAVITILLYFYYCDYTTAAADVVAFC